MSQEANEILEKLDAEIRDEVLTPKRRAVAIELANSLGYELQDRDWRLLSDLYAYKINASPTDQTPTTEAELGTKRMIKARATKPQHAFWKVLGFKLIGMDLGTEVDSSVQQAYQAELLEQAQRLGYIVASQGDHDTITIFAFHKAAQESLGSDYQPEMSLMVAWRMVHTNCSHPDHPFWLYVVYHFLSL